MFFKVRRNSSLELAKTVRVCQSLIQDQGPSGRPVATAHHRGSGPGSNLLARRAASSPGLVLDLQQQSVCARMCVIGLLHPPK